MVILAWEQSRQVGLTDEAHARTWGEEKGIFVKHSITSQEGCQHFTSYPCHKSHSGVHVLCVCPSSELQIKLKYLNVLSINITTIIICPPVFPVSVCFDTISIGSFSKSCWKTSAECGTKKITLFSQSVHFTLTTWYHISNLQCSGDLWLFLDPVREGIPGCFSCGRGSISICPWMFPGSGNMTVWVDVI